MERQSPLRFVWLAVSCALCYPVQQQWSATAGAFWLVVNYFAVKYSFELWIVSRTLRRDLTAGVRQWNSKRTLRAQIERRATVPLLFTESATRYPDKLFLSSAFSSWSFAESRHFTNRVANHFRSRGLNAGDDVCLLMENRPEFVLIWLGLSKLGVVTALINHKIKASALAHCVNAVGTKAVICSNSLAGALGAAYDQINDSASIEFYHLDSGQLEADAVAGSVSLLDSLEHASTHEQIYQGHCKDKLLHIFTSGTTGLPKAAIVTNLRYMYVASNMYHMCAFSAEDKVYVSLPLYHNSASALGVGPCLIYGLSCHVGSRFSASNFWSDCERYHCSVALYIGEMVRYLLAQAENTASDRTHGVRMLYGHGARKLLWKAFQTRFNIAQLVEVYGSTEGNAGLMNIDNEPGAIGFLSTASRMSRTIARAVLPMFVVKLDPETGTPVRDGRGFCVECKPNEPGELVGLITTQPATRFEGYVDREATQKKIYVDVFRAGENAFATGDIVVYDDLGYVFFQDRTGDTFRWKGENVSTNEVEGVLGAILGLKDATVYGVRVEGAEGKAGMAAIAIEQENDDNKDDDDDDDDNAKDPNDAKDAKVDLNELLVSANERLPDYAIPLFVRLTKRIESTSTLKYKKNSLVADGFNPNEVRDPLFFLDRSKMKYVPLDRTLYSEIISGKVRL